MPNNGTICINKKNQIEKGTHAYKRGTVRKRKNSERDNSEAKNINNKYFG